MTEHEIHLTHKIAELEAEIAKLQFTVNTLEWERHNYQKQVAELETNLNECRDEKLRQKMLDNPPTMRDH